jgi:hypothetical protein
MDVEAVATLLPESVTEEEVAFLPSKGMRMINVKLAGSGNKVKWHWDFIPAAFA